MDREIKTKKYRYGSECPGVPPPIFSGLDTKAAKCWNCAAEVDRKNSKGNPLSGPRTSKAAPVVQGVGEILILFYFSPSPALSKPLPWSCNLLASVGMAAMWALKILRKLFPLTRGTWKGGPSVLKSEVGRVTVIFSSSFFSYLLCLPGGPSFKQCVRTQGS